MDIIEHKIKSVIISEKDTKDEIKREFNQFGRIEKEGNLVKRIPDMQLFITTLNVYDKNKLIYKIKYSNSIRDTTFYEYDSLGRLMFEFEQSSTYPKLIEYCYIGGYNKKDIHYTPHEIRTYRKPSFYFYPNQKKMNYKNENAFYLESYRRGQYDSSFHSNEEYFYEILNPFEILKSVDSFYLNQRVMRIKHTDSLIQEIILEITPSNYYREGVPINKNGREFSSNERLKKTTLNYYSNKKLVHQSIKEFATDNEVTYLEIDYRYNEKGLLLEKEEDIKYYFLSIHSQPVKGYSKYIYTYEYW